MEGITYLLPERVIRAHVTDTPSYGRTVTGYGAKIPTRYTLQMDDGRTRRVYAMQYGNSASLYVVAHGRDAFLSVNVESMLEHARDRVI